MALNIGDLYADLDAPDAALDAYRLARETAQRIQDGFKALREWYEKAEQEKEEQTEEDGDEETLK